MNKKKVFDILCIAATKDVNIIKKAYRKNLVLVNPEDDPEGFRLLREAYEEAIRLASVEEEDEPADTPVMRWIKRAEAVYNKLSSRINPTCWRELFYEDICRDFDTAGEVREAFLGFMMDHFRLPEEVWQLIEETFQLVDSKEDLYEKFPVEFIDFVTQDAQSKGWLDYTLFEGDDEADIDGFIGLFLSLRRMNDSSEYEGAAEALEKLEQINLWHPNIEAEKIRYFLSHKRLEEAKEIAEDLRLKKVQDLYARYYIAELYLESGDLKNAFAECRAILEASPEHFGARVLLCTCYLKKGEYEESKKRCLDLLEIDNYNENLREVLEKVNVELIKSFKQQLEDDPDNKALRLELGWCFYQNKLFEECTALTSNLEIDDEIYYDYYNLMSRVYIELGEFKKGLPLVEKWLAEILKTQNDGTEETKKRLQRLSLAYYFMSRCFYNFGMEKEDKKEDFDKCIQYIDKAVEAEKDTGNILQYLLAKAQVLLKLEENKLCIDVCDKILEKDKGYYPAYVLRQEAYFNLKMAMEVINDYYNAIEIYTGDANPYVLAARVYLIYNQCEEAAAVINRAKESGVESNELLFLGLKNRRLMAGTNEERKEVASELYKLYVKAQKEIGNLKEITDLLHEQALCYCDADDYKTALEIIEKKLMLKKSDESINLKGDILFYMKKHGDVFKYYRKILKEDPNYFNAYYKIGLNYRALGREDEAIDSFLKASANDPEHPYVNNELAEFYKQRYMKKYKKEDYDKAVKYAKRQAEINPHCYYYTELGIVYMDGYQLEEAIKAFEEASKYDDSSPYPYNNAGIAYKTLGDLDRSCEYYKLAIERISDDELIAYWNIADCYRIMGQYENAIETYEMIKEKGGDSESANEKLIETYHQMGAWEKALEEAKKFYELGECNHMDYLLEAGDKCSFTGNVGEARRFYEEAIKRFIWHSKPYTKMGNYLLWIVGDKKNALKYFKKAYKLAREYEPDNQEEALGNIISALKELYKEKKGAKYMGKIYKLHKKSYGSTEDYLNNPKYRKVRIYYLAVSNYNVGQYEEARHYMSIMKESLNCSHCTYCTCYEFLELEGMMLELQKDYAGALEKYQKAREIAPDNMHYIYKMKELKEKAEMR